MEIYKRKYKTSLCRHFETGNCSLKERCLFAHGPKELRDEFEPLHVNVPEPAKAS
jgi:hypothetical protein